MRYRVICVKDNICTVLYEDYDIQAARIYMFSVFYNELHKYYDRPFLNINKHNKDRYMMSLNSCCIADVMTLHVVDTAFWIKYSEN